MNNFEPDYTNILQAANNLKPNRMPLYEHIISEKVMEEILNKEFAELINGNLNDKREYIRNYVSFYKQMGYDTVSFERLITAVMPGSGALYSNKKGVIKTREDFKNYPWEDIPKRYFVEYKDDYRLLKEEMPAGMKAIGGPGNGVFECVQDIVGLVQLSYISIDDPQLYTDLFGMVGDVIYKIWKSFLEKFGDTYVVCRFGDDLGFKTSTLLSPRDIRKNIIPQYKKIVKLIHSYNKPFLLHSCGNIFEVMDDLIEVVGIDAKHSNEDQIAPFSTWLDKYGERIGNFGGIDTGIFCQKGEEEIKEIVREIVTLASNYKGFALGSGNSIADYVPVNGYLAMIETVREIRNK